MRVDTLAQGAFDPLGPMMLLPPMPFRPTDLYRRTPLGVAEIEKKSHRYTQSERLILVLLDGRLTVAGLQTRLPRLAEARITQVLERLRDEGLIADEPLPAPGEPGQPARLAPEAVSAFLEQQDLDPLTRPLDLIDDVVAEVMPAPAEPSVATAAAAQPPVGQGPAPVPPEVRAAPQHPPGSSPVPRETPRGQQKPMPDKASGESMRLHQERPTTISAPATQFAITTINVPDRLDLQHENDRRAQVEADTQRIEAIKSHRGVRLALLAGLGAALALGAYSLVQPALQEVSAPRLSERLTQAAGVPVRVAAAEFRFTPAPHLFLGGVAVDGAVTLEQVQLQINWADVWNAVRGGRWVWGEATVGPTRLTLAQAAVLVRRAAGIGAGLPASVTTVRFRDLQFPGVRLLPGSYEAVLRRGDGRFASVTLVGTGTDGAQLSFRPSGPAADAPITFTLDAERWTPPVGPAVRWAEVRATGQLDDHRAEAAFVLKGLYGVVTGSVMAVGDGAWGLAGNVDLTNLDLEAVAAAMRGGDEKSGAGSTPPPFQGTVSAALTLAAKGPDFESALSAASLSGPFSVRWAQLNGVNLGLAATQGSLGGGITRFTDFSGQVAANSAGLSFTDTGGKAGALAARANFRMTPKRELDGTVRVALGGQTVQAPVTLRLRGTAEKPQFTR